MSSVSSASGGIGFVGLLTVAFIILKLLGKIDWSWWWVLSPPFITFGVIVFILVCAAVIAAMAVKK